VKLSPCRTLGAIVGGALVLGGCAPAPVVEAPPAPPPRPTVATVPPPNARVTAMLTQQRRLADAARQAGDLASVQTHLEILATLAPDDPAIARELTDVGTTIDNEVREQYRLGRTALAAGELERAQAAMLRVLALDPREPNAPTALREIERRRLTRIQADRVAKLPPPEEPVTKSRAPAGPAPMPAPEGGNDAFAVDQALELLRAGDTASGLRDLKGYVAANPGNHAARQRIGAAVAERAQDLEGQGQREEALRLYEQASALRGDAGGPWAARLEPLRKKISQDYFAKGTRAFRTNLPQAIRDLEASVRFDPGNAQAAIKLQEARTAREKLDRIK